STRRKPLVRNARDQRQVLQPLAAGYLGPAFPVRDSTASYGKLRRKILLRKILQRPRPADPVPQPHVAPQQDGSCPWCRDSGTVHPIRERPASGVIDTVGTVG